jgi:hypothetical protein
MSFRDALRFWIARNLVDTAWNVGVFLVLMLCAWIWWKYSDWGKTVRDADDV